MIGYYNIEQRDNVFQLKDPWSAITHAAGAAAATIGMPALLIRASEVGAGIREMIGFAIFMASMILLYSASALYHSIHCPGRVDEILKRIDHMSIFVLIAGSYTPVCLTVLRGSSGNFLLALIWTIAILGMGFKAFWVHCPKFISSIIYIAMGWVCMLFLPKILASMPLGAFLWLLAGGLAYTVGGVLYSAKKSICNHPGFGNHEVFHCFVLAGSLCHYIVMFAYLVSI